MTDSDPLVDRVARRSGGLYEDLYESSHYFDFEIADFLYVWKSGRFLSRSRCGEMQRVEMNGKAA